MLMKTSSHRDVVDTHPYRLRDDKIFVSNIKKFNNCRLVVKLASINAGVHILYHRASLERGEKPGYDKRASLWTVFPNQNLERFWELYKKYSQGISQDVINKMKAIDLLGKRILVLESHNRDMVHYENVTAPKIRKCVEAIDKIIISLKE